MVFSNAVSAVMTIFLVGLLGFILKRRGWVSPETAKVLPKLLTTVILPPFLLRNVTTTFSHDQLLDMLSGSVVPYLSILLCYAVSVILMKLFRIRYGRRGTFMVSFSTSNTMNIGLPIALALFGEAAVPHVLLYFFASVTLFWTLGNYLLAHDGVNASVKVFSLTTLKQIFSPPLIGFMCGILLVVLDVQLPAFLDKAFKYVGDMTVAVAVMYIGILLADVRLGDLHLERDVLLVVFGRIVIAPLTTLLVAHYIAIPDMMFQVFVIQSSLPVMMNVAIMSGYYKTDVKYSAILVSVTTLMAILTVPLWAVLLGLFMAA